MTPLFKKQNIEDLDHYFSMLENGGKNSERKNSIVD